MPDQKSSRFNRSCIRRARQEDAEKVVRLILELAEFEKLSEEAKPSVEAMSSALVDGAPRPLFVFLAEDPDTKEAVGFMLCFLTFSTFCTGWQVYIEDVYVRESCRGHGLGKLLLGQAAVVAKSVGAERVDLQVLKWNEDAIEMYKKLGARERSDWKPFRFEGDALEALAQQCS